MVKSGLDHNNFLGPCDVPRVSQYRLAAHLSSAVVLYSVLFWNAKSVLRPSITWSQVLTSFLRDWTKNVLFLGNPRHGSFP